MMPEPRVLDGVLAGLLPPHACERWLAAIDALDAVLPPDHAERQPTSGSIRLRALGRAAFAALLQRCAGSGPGGAALRALLGVAGDAPLQCLAAHCWVRRQYPPGLRPAGQHPHQWHQDGALGCRFDGRTAEALLPLATLWLPLLACGEDAPSLEWVPAVPALPLLQPAELAPAAVAQRFAQRHQARLAAGDALLFDGALLHRTHVTPAMSGRRVSIELRFVAGALPARLGGEPTWTVPG